MDSVERSAAGEANANAEAESHAEGEAEVHEEARAEGEAQELQRYEDLAQKIDYPVLAPTLTGEDVHRACRLANGYQIAALVVRPSDADLALEWLKGSRVKVASVAGYPHGSTTTAAKLYEVRDLLRRGIRQIDVVPNVGRMISREFHYAEMELWQIAEDCREAGAVLKVLIPSALFNEEMKIIACRMAKRVRAHFAAATEPRDADILVKRCGSRIGAQIGSVPDLDRALALLKQGVTHLAATKVSGILEAWTARLEEREKAARQGA